MTRKIEETLAGKSKMIVGTWKIRPRVARWDSSDVLGSGAPRLLSEPLRANRGGFSLT